MVQDVLLNLTKQQPDADEIYLYVKDAFELKYELLINGREKVRKKTPKNPKAFIDYSQTIDDVYENLENYNLPKKKRVLLVFDDMIADIESTEKLSPIVTELLVVFISQSYFKESQTIRLNATHYVIAKIPNTRNFNK